MYLSTIIQYDLSGLKVTVFETGLSDFDLLTITEFKMSF